MTTSTTKDLAPADLLTWDDVPYDEPEDTGIRPIWPEIRIIQKGVPTIPGSEKNAGAFYVSEEGGYFTEKLVGVFLASQQTRALFEDGGQKPLCKSANGVSPLPNQPLWDGRDRFQAKDGPVAVPVAGEPTTCAVCPLSQWFDDQRPPCGQQYLTLFEIENGSLAQFRIKGTSIAAFRQFYGRLRGEGVKRGAKRIGRPLFSQRVALELEKHTDQGGRMWYTLKVEPLEMLSPSDGLEYAAFVTGVRGTLLTAAAAVSDEPDQDAPVREAVTWEDA